MSVSHTFTIEPQVLSGSVVRIEADVSKGLHSFTIVGLAGKAVEEAKDRVSAAVKNSGFTSPKSTNQKITISLSPADLKKEGPLYDLPIALAYLEAVGEVTLPREKIAYLGELSLDGSLQAVRGVLAATQKAKEEGFAEIIVPEQNVSEAALVSGITVIGAPSLTAVLDHIDKGRETAAQLKAAPQTTLKNTWQDGSVLLEDIRGQEAAKRALIIAAAGRHNVLMVGPPGTGKTMLAKAFRGLLPPLSSEEAIEVLSIHSVAGTLEEATAEAPFRAPHHSASHVSLIGGGSNPRPGEATLAHRGVLFMDEFPEFERRSIDALRQPLEDREVTISRARGTVTFPADFILVAAMNPYRGAEDGTTDFYAAMQDTYKQKVSGPILDRIDLWIEVPHVDYETLTEKGERKKETEDARNSINTARAIALKRYADTDLRTNHQLSARTLTTFAPLTPAAEDTLKNASKKLNLSPRSYHRVIKVARTIADLAAADTIDTPHVLEALQYRVQL